MWDYEARDPNRPFFSAELIGVGDTWARRTTVSRARVEKRGPPTVLLKESLFDSTKGYQERELLTQVNKEGPLPLAGAPGHDCVEVDDRGTALNECESPQSLSMKKNRTWCADIGFNLTLAESINDLLKATYDALEVHRVMAVERGCLHRDISIFNLFVSPSSLCSRRPFRRQWNPSLDYSIKSSCMSVQRTL
ncbi:hypothetical protein C8Q70DRAFT_1001688 [Cubamyces menziesii]|nr:hypothetical protein C8Q70DRAFT_1001688 [Cubamyces menziesii]